MLFLEKKQFRHDASNADLWGVDEQNQAAWLDEQIKIFEKVHAAYNDMQNMLGIPGDSFDDTMLQVYIPVSQWIYQKYLQLHKSNCGQVIIGIGASIGAGKSTMSRAIKLIFESTLNLTAAVVSIDNLYRTKYQRKIMADEIHPLFEYRGVPGTHDLNIADSVFYALKTASNNSEILIPVFDKSIDDRLPEEQWELHQGRPDIIIFEGWCVGAKPQSLEALLIPVNSIEEKLDRDAVWRVYSNEQLKNGYQGLFSVPDALIFLRIPGWEMTLNQRWEQKEEKREKHLSRDDYNYVLMLCQRLSQQMNKEMPNRADLILGIDETRRLIDVRFN